MRQSPAETRKQTGMQLTIQKRPRGQRGSKVMARDTTPAGSRGTRSRPGGIKVFIARLSDGDISAMGREDLIELLHTCDVDFPCPDTRERLEFLDDRELVRLLFLVRRCCRNQVNSFDEWLGDSSYDM